MRSKAWLPVTILILALIAPLGCGSESSETSTEKSPAKGTQTTESKVDTTPAYGDALVIGSLGDASTLLPALASDTASTDVIGLVYNGLIKVDKDLNLVGDLAESWDISDDNLTITFHLRKNVKWHDGEPFTARDCLYTYKVMVDPKTPTAYAEQFKQIEKAEVVDDFTFRVTSRKVFARALITWSQNIMPAHLLEGKDITTSELARHPIGTGPYRFLSWETNQQIVLEYNPDYFEGRPYIDRQIMRVIPDMATQFLELRSGTIDQMGLTPDQYTKQTNDEAFKANFNKYKYLAFAYTYMGFNLKDPKFQDKRVRQAIAFAINKQEIIDGVILGLGKPANGPYQPGHWAYNPNVEPYPFDQEKAKQLLAEAGWKDTDNDGILDKDNQPFEFTIMTNQGNKQRELTAQIIQQRLKGVGISVKVRVIEWAAFLKEFIDKKKFEAVVLGWTIPLDPDLYNVWHSSKTREGELNFISFKNDEVDRLVDEGRFTLDREKRKQAYYRIQEILKDEVPYIFLYVPDTLPVVSSRVHGIEPAPAGIGYNFVKWYVPKDLQKYHFEP
jgi:peptide/nickel transport system substrate-binding protein